MEDWQQRVVEEKAALDMKIQRLEEFMDSEIYLTQLSEDECSDLFEQLQVMECYSQVLARRIDRFTDEVES